MGGVSASGVVLARFALLPALLVASACSGGDGAGAAVQAGEAPRPVHLEAWAGAPGGPLGEASYKVKGAPAAAELKVDVEHAKPGSKHALTLDGFALGDLIADLDGEAEFEHTGALPAGCPAPRVGSVIEVGELLVLELKTLERQLDLEAVIAGPGSLAGKVTFRVDRVGDAVARELTVKVTGAQADSLHPVTLAGLALGELEVDEDGEGKLELSSRKGPPFPAAFQDPAAGAEIQLGTLFSGRLEARVAAAR